MPETVSYATKEGNRYEMRDATIADLSVVYAIWQAGMKQHGYTLEAARDAEYRSYLEGLIHRADQTFKFWVALDEAREIAGWQALMPYSNNPFTREFSAECSTYVRPTKQATGLAYILLSHAVTHARQTRLHHLLALVAEDNKAISRIAEKMGGWELIGRIPPSPKPPERPGLNAFLSLLT